MTLEIAATARLHGFDAATEIRRDGDRMTGHTSEAYWAFVGPFGGVTAATLLRAVLSDPRAAGDALALTVNYAAPIATGPFDLTPVLARANRSTQHWTVELRQGGGDPAALASVVLAERRPSWSHQVLSPPVVPPSDVLPRRESGSVAWPRQYAFRFVSGGDDFNSPEVSTRSEVWIADAEPRVLDHLSLASMGDAFFGRIFQAKRGIVPFGTVSMTTHFHVSAAELAEDGATEVLGVADARTFHRSYGDQTAELWSPSGRLLATTTQMFYFKA
jgi:hypothetical protein